MNTLMRTTNKIAKAFSISQVLLILITFMNSRFDSNGKIELTFLESEQEDLLVTNLDLQ